jgi:hypothetical protein
MTLAEFFQQIYPLLLNRVMDRVEKDLVEGKVTAYWAGTIIRIDIKPKGS